MDRSRWKIQWRFQRSEARIAPPYLIRPSMPSAGDGGLMAGKLDMSALYRIAGDKQRSRRNTVATRAMRLVGFCISLP